VRCWVQAASDEGPEPAGDATRQEVHEKGRSTPAVTHASKLACSGSFFLLTLRSFKGFGPSRLAAAGATPVRIVQGGRVLGHQLGVPALPADPRPDLPGPASFEIDGHPELAPASFGDPRGRDHFLRPALGAS